MCGLRQDNRTQNAWAAFLLTPVRANYADKVARGDFSTPNTTLPTTPHKSASNIKGVQGAKKMRSSPYANAPLNILGGGSFRWPNTPKLDRCTLENIWRCEIGAAP